MIYYTDMTFGRGAIRVNFEHRVLRDTGPLIFEGDNRFIHTSILTRTKYLPITLKYPLRYVLDWGCERVIGKVVRI